MSGFLIAVSAAVFLLFCFFVAKKLDAFLERQTDRRETLRIGMEYPGMEKTVAEEIGSLGDTFPGYELSLTGGEREELCRMLESGTIDIAILESVPEQEPFRCVTKPMQLSPVTSEETGLPVVRQLSDLKTAFILMRSAENTALCGVFYRLLTGKSS